MKKSIPVIVVLVMIPILLAFVPVSQKRILSRGVDSYEKHKALFGDRVATQEFTTSGQLLGAGGILVDMLRSGQPADVKVRIIDPATDAELASAIIPGGTLVDDQFSFTRFSSRVAGIDKTLRVEFSAPHATAKNPVGVRFAPSSSSPEEKLFAVQLLERVPLWQYIITNFQSNTARWRIILSAGAGALVIGVLACKPGWNNNPSRIQRAIELGIIIAIAALALNSRLDTIPLFKGVSGGDPYNYLFITDSLVDLKNPFAGVKRLPGYPLLLTPAYLSQSIDDQIAMRAISAVAGAGSLIMLALLARALGLPWAVQLATPAILAWQKDFFWTSLRPEAYTVFTFLLLTALVLFFTAKKSWQQILFGIALGYAAMTRQEGFVLAAILGLASIVHEIYLLRINKYYKLKAISYKLLRMYLPAFLIVLPFFIHNTLEYGNPLFTPYFEGERLQIVDSWEAFKDAAGATWGVLGSMWKPNWDQLERFALTDRPFLLFSIGLIAWFVLGWLAKQATWLKIRDLHLLHLTLGITGTILFISFLWMSFAHKPVFAAWTPIATSAMLLASSIPFVWKTSWRGFLVWLVMASQILVATWFHPFPKHYQQSYPLLVLMITTALVTPILWLAASQHNRLLVRTAQTTLLAAFLVPFFIIPLYLFQNNAFNPYIDKYNADVALDTVVYQAIQAARQLSGPHGVDEAYLPARLYLGEETHYFPAEPNPTPEQEQQWLTTSNIRTLVTTNNNNVLSNPGTGWRQVDYVVSEGEDERLFKSWVYVKQ